MNRKSKILFTFHYGEENMRSIEKLGYEVIYVDEEKIEGSKGFEDIEILVCYHPFKLVDISKLKNLKWIQLVSKGINHVPVVKTRNQNILVTNNVTGPAIPISEWVITSLLQIFKKSKSFYERQGRKSWEVDKDILEIYGKTIGFLGTGNIATQAAKRLKAFETTVIGVNELDIQADYFDRCYGLDDIDELFTNSDAIVSTLPDTEDTYHFLNEEAFNKMKKGVALVNISRGSVIDEEALIKKIKEDHFRGVALDVFEKEPLSQDSPLWDFDNVIITPHNALYSDLYNQRVFDMIVDNLKRYKEGKQLCNIVDFERRY